MLISGWSNPTEGILSLTGITIVNPPAAVSYSILGTFYFVENATNYQIETVSLSVSLTELSFTTLTFTGPLTYGSLLTLAITADCSITQQSSKTTSAYSILTHPTS